MNQTIIQERSGLNQFYAKVYAFVGIGIALSALVSALMLTTFQDLLVQLMLNARIWLIVTGIVEVALVIFASGLAVKNSPATLPIFLLYSVVNGFSLSFIVSLYLPGTVLTAFISSAALFCHGYRRSSHQKRFEWDRSCFDCSPIWFDTRYGCQYLLK